MPTYEHECSEHGLFNDVRPMAESGKSAPCPKCGAECAKVYFTSPALMQVDGGMWHDENNGRGRYIGQLADKPGDKRAYCHSRSEAMEKAKRRGFEATRA